MAQRADTESPLDRVAKQVCVDCHFLTLVTTIREERRTSLRDREEGAGSTEITSNTFEQTAMLDERDAARRGDFTWTESEIKHLRCWHRVWDVSYSDPEKGLYHEIVEKERTDYCFFFPYRRGMLNPAASVLQERAENRREARRDRRLTIVGLWIAALALVAGVFVETCQGGGNDIPRMQSIEEEGGRERR